MIRAFIAFRLKELENYFRVGASMATKLRYQFLVSDLKQYADRAWNKGRQKLFLPIFPRIKRNFSSPRPRFK